MYKNGEKVGSPKKRPQTALGALFGEAEKKPRFFFKPPEGRPRDLEMAPEGVRKRKRQNRDFYNTSELISPFLRWEGPWK